MTAPEKFFTFTIAALEERERQMWNNALEEAALFIDHTLENAGDTVTANTMRRVYAELATSIRNLKKGGE
jgi:hypothetical protein